MRTASANPQGAAITVLVVDLDGSVPALPLHVEAEAFETVVVVRNGKAPDRWTYTQRLEVSDSCPYGAALNRGLAAATAPIVVLLGSGSVPAPGTLADLVRAFDTQPELVAALPVVTDESGRVLETGTVLTDDGVLRGVDTTAAGPRNAFSQTSDGTAWDTVAFRRSVPALLGGVLADAPDATTSVADIVLALHASDYAVRVHPAFRVAIHHDAQPKARVALDVLRREWPNEIAALPANSGLAAQVAVRQRSRPTDRILVIHSRVPRPSLTLRDRHVALLLEMLITNWVGAHVTLMTPEEGYGAPERNDLCARGVEVVESRNWKTWFDRRPLQYSLVILTDTRLDHTLTEHLDRTQPQAARVLLADDLDFRLIEKLEPTLAPGSEMRGLHSLRGLVRERVATTLERVHAVWCMSEADRRYVTGLFPALPCVLLPHPVDGPARVPTWDERRDIAVLAAPAADIYAAHEDAAARAVEEIFPLLQGRDRALRLRIFSDRPTPRIQRLAEREGVRLERLDRDPTLALAEARLCLVAYSHGTGGRSALSLAVAAGTPFVTTPVTLDGRDLTPLQDELVGDDAATLAQRAWALLTDRSRWRHVHDRILDWRVSQGSAAFQQVVTQALADLGVAPPPRAVSACPRFVPEFNLAPPPPVLPVPADRRQHRVDPGLAAKTSAAPAPPVDEQYARWLRRYAPTEEQLKLLARKVRGAQWQPTISIIMPTFNTDPVVLEDALASVAAQVYDKWELCIADDHSSRPETRAILEHWTATDSRVKVTFLETNTGISGASNAALAHATGEYVALLDHDDEIKPHALATIVLRINDDPHLDLLYSDEDKRDETGKLVEPFFKPDWSPDHLMSRNYIGHLVVLRRALLEEVGGFRLQCAGSQDYDLLLRVTERTDRIVHVADTLYTWRRVAGSTAAAVDAKPQAFQAAKLALGDALMRREIPGTVEDGLLPSTYRVRYDLVGRPKVTIIIPTRDRLPLLRQCIDSVRARSTYNCYEFLVVDNESADPETLEYLATYGGRVLRYPHPFNYARMMNLAAWAAGGDLLLFLNNDTEVLSPAWLEALIEHAQRAEVGAVGARLLYPDGRVQHEGVIVNYAAGAAGNVDHQGWWGFGDVVRNASAVTGAVTMMRPSVFFEVGGYEERLPIAFNDIDLCLRVRQAGYHIVYTPYALLYHHESATRGSMPHPEDSEFFERRWELRGGFYDPFYNANLDRSHPFRIYS